jgi:hypothetical protein
MKSTYYYATDMSTEQFELYISSPQRYGMSSTSNYTSSYNNEVAARI